MKTILFPIMFLFVFNPVIYSQDNSKLHFGVEIPVKVSLPYSSVQSLDYNGIATYNAPLFSTYRDPVFGVNLGLLYNLSEKFSAGFFSGVLGELYEQHSFFKNEYYHRFMFPVYGKFRYQTPLSQKMDLLLDLNLGYQIFSNTLDNDTDGYYFTSRGGFLAGLDAGTGFKINDYKIFLKIGYEINQYKNTDRMDWGSMATILKPEDKISYHVYYQVIRISLELDF